MISLGFDISRKFRYSCFQEEYTIEQVKVMKKITENHRKRE